MSTHCHRIASSSEERCFTIDVAHAHHGPIVGGRPRYNRSAHGGVEVTDRCRCGAARRRLINGPHVERSAWYDPGAERRVAS